jgi:hypothetical protein
LALRSFFITAGELILIGVPAALLVKRSPESMGLAPDGALPEKKDARRSQPRAKTAGK